MQSWAFTADSRGSRHADPATPQLSCFPSVTRKPRETYGFAAGSRAPGAASRALLGPQAPSSVIPKDGPSAEGRRVGPAQGSGGALAVRAEPDPASLGPPGPERLPAP